MSESIAPDVAQATEVAESLEVVAQALTPKETIALKKALIAKMQADLKALREQTKALANANKAARVDQIEAALDRKLERLETRKVMESRKALEERAKEQKRLDAIAKQARLDGERLRLNGSAHGRNIVQARIFDAHTKPAIETRGLRLPEPIYVKW